MELGMENNRYSFIKFVALYLRKSRGDSEDDLKKHKLVLHELCKKYDWKFVEYCEIESGDSISGRPIFQSLLLDITNGLYDAVACVEIDRLGRGDTEDRGKINNIFLNSNTLIATPDKIYDLQNDHDDFIVEAKGFLARQEYKQIVKRLLQGKRVGAKMGNWTNGTPPFPYEYERWQNKFNEKGIVVNDEKLSTYRFIIDKALKGLPPTEIAWELNKQGILSPRSKKWSNVTVYRLLKDETHLGKIISNKGLGDSHSNKKPSAKEYKRNIKSDWVVIENCHKSVKTLEEHNIIEELIRKRTSIPERARAGIYGYSYLIKCGICSHNITFYTKKDGSMFMKPCWYVDAYGNKCTNRGIKINYIDECVKIALEEKRSEYLNKAKEEVNTEDKINEIRLVLNSKRKELDKYEKAYEKVNDSYDLGEYTKTEWQERKVKWEKEIQRVEIEMTSMETQIDNLKIITNDEILHIINDVLDNFEKIKNEKKKNDLLKTIIEKITWTRKENDMFGDFKISFLYGINSER